jgi:hypothetical protein
MPRRASVEEMAKAGRHASERPSREARATDVTSGLPRVTEIHSRKLPPDSCRLPAQNSGWREKPFSTEIVDRIEVSQLLACDASIHSAIYRTVVSL